VAPVLGDLTIALQRGSCVLFRPALCLYVVLAALLILTVRMRAPRILAAFLPALLATASVLMVPIATQIRYQFPLTLTAAFLVGLAFAARPARDLGEIHQADATPGEE
jgi:peptidoglycan/LPS O-acetylase OafA/YrhL